MANSMDMQFIETAFSHAPKLGTTKTFIGVTTAKKLWANNQDNPRPFKKWHAIDIARQMDLGRWGLSPEPLVVTRSGRVVNGQHRIWAIMHTGVGQDMFVVVIEDADFEKVASVIDQGLKRSHSDILKADKQILQPITYLLRGTGVKRVKPEDIKPYLDGRVGQLLQDIVDQKTKATRRIWTTSQFRAAMVVAILGGFTDRKLAWRIYGDICDKNIANWPSIFGELYVQLTDNDRNLNRSGSNLNNDNFMRTLFAFKAGYGDTKSIRIMASFKAEAKAAALRIMKNDNPCAYM